jgi:hypothetical protein
VPELNEDFGADAASFLAQLVGNGKRFVATVVRRERGLGAREKHPRKAADKLQVRGAVTAAAEGGLVVFPSTRGPAWFADLVVPVFLSFGSNGIFVAWQQQQRLCD